MEPQCHHIIYIAEQVHLNVFQDHFDFFEMQYIRKICILVSASGLLYVMRNWTSSQFVPKQEQKCLQSPAIFEVCMTSVLQIVLFFPLKQGLLSFVAVKVLRAMLCALLKPCTPLHVPPPPYQVIKQCQGRQQKMCSSHATQYHLGL